MDLQDIRDTKVDSGGRALTLCAIHRVEPDQAFETQAIMVVAGYSVCDFHADALLALLALGVPIEAIIQGIYDGQFQETLDELRKDTGD